MIECWRKGLATLMVDTAYLHQLLTSSPQSAVTHILLCHRLRIIMAGLILPHRKTIILLHTQIIKVITHNPTCLINRDHFLTNRNLKQHLLKLHTSQTPHPRRHTSNTMDTVALNRKSSLPFSLLNNHPNLLLRQSQAN